MSPPGDLRAYDVITGKLAWQFHTVPHPGEFGYETWPKDAWKYIGGVNTWGEITIDAKRGIAYFPTGSPTYDYYGADRLGANLFGDSPDRAGRAHRQAAVALPDGAPRPLGLRQQRRAAADDDQAERQEHRRRRAGRQDGLPLRLRSRDRQADVADRGTAGAEERHARRTVVADAAVPDGAAAVQQADVHRRRHQSAPHRQRADREKFKSASRRRAIRGCSRRFISRTPCTSLATTGVRSSATRRPSRPTVRST